MNPTQSVYPQSQMIQDDLGHYTEFGLNEVARRIDSLEKLKRF